VKQSPDKPVATIDGKQLSARQAWGMLSKVAPPTRRDFESKGQLSNLLQRVYTQNRIAEEAIQLHLDRQQPWLGQLQRAHMVIIKNNSEYSSEPEKDIPPAIVAEWHSTRDKILWNAYFGQASSPDAKKTLHDQVNAKYHIDVLDSNFFK